MTCPPAVYLVGFLRESDEKAGLEHLVESASGQYGLGRDEVVQLVEQSTEASLELARLLT